jgi:methyl-accepting chemotaxis protein
MPDNLTVQISANADKLRADLAKAQANVRDFAKQLRDAAAEARKTGDDTRLKKVAAQYEAASRQVRGLTRALREQNAALDATTDKAAGLSKTLGTLGIGLQSTIEKFGKGIFGGLAGATGITKALDVIGQVTDQLNEIRKLEAGTGFSKETIRALQLGLTQTGQAGEKLSGMLVQFAGASGDADKKLRELNKSTEEMSHKFVQVGDGAADTISQIRTMRAEFSQGGKAVQDTVNVWRGAHGRERPVCHARN